LPRWRLLKSQNLRSRPVNFGKGLKLTTAKEPFLRVRIL
jgi:hypothetical protein